MYHRSFLSKAQLEFNKIVFKKYEKHFKDTSDIAEKYGVTTVSVQVWRRTGRLPKYLVQDLCKMFKLKKYQLRPDIYDETDS